MPHYAVVQEKLERIDAPSLAKILTEYGGMLRVDAMQLARREQGILGVRFEKESAIAVAGAMTRSGIAARALPADELPKLPAARIVRWIELTDDELQIPDGRGQKVITAAWPAIFVISAGRVREQIERRVQTPRGIQPGTNEVVHDVETITETKVRHVTHVSGIADTGELFNICLLAEELSYGRILKKLEGTAFQRYLATLEQLISRSGSAFVSPRTRMLLVTRKEHARDVSGSAEILDLQTFHKYNRWMLTLVLFNERKKSG